jgi:hypothetical protein
MMVALPAHLSVAQARLPATYESAKQALAQCSSVDECQDWADKAEALASYARQVEDDSLRKMADRIQARAVRRCGELLKQFDGRGGDRTKTDGAVSSAPTQKEAAQQAGLSERQQVTAVRVANVPAETFEKAIESDNPPTVTKLAELGTQKRARIVFTCACGEHFADEVWHCPTCDRHWPLHTDACANCHRGERPQKESPAPQMPDGFKHVAALLGQFSRFVQFCEAHDPTVMAESVTPDEAAELRKQVAVIDA